MKLSSKDKRELRLNLLGCIGVAAGTFYIFNRAEIDKTVCDFVTGTACDFLRHRFEPTWRRVALGMLVFSLLASAVHLFLVLKSSRNRVDQTAEVSIRERTAVKVPSGKPEGMKRDTSSVPPSTAEPTDFPTSADGSAVTEHRGKNNSIVKDNKQKLC